MKIPSIQTTLLTKNFNNAKNYFTNVQNTNSLTNDVFVKNTSNISFKASNNNNNNDDFWMAIAALTACAGGTILLSSILKATTPESDYIFGYDGNVLGRKSVFQKEAKFKEMLDNSGIDMSRERFTYADTINGIYKNPGRGIDINLMKEKYVDPENGIYIDKEQGVSAIFRDNEFTPIVMRGNPTFEGAPMSGWHAPHIPSYKHVDRAEFIEKHGKAPEDMENFEEVIGYNRGYDGIKIDPIERRNFLEKIYDFVTNRDKGFTHDYWGREVVTVKDYLGREHKVPLDDQISDMIDKHNLRYEDVQYFATYMAKNPIEGYIKDIPFSDIQEYALNKVTLSEFLAGAKAKANAELVEKIDEKYTDNVSHTGHTHEPMNEPSEIVYHDIPDTPDHPDQLINPDDIDIDVDITELL